MSFFNDNYDIFEPNDYKIENIYCYYSGWTDYVVIEKGEEFKFKMNLQNNMYNVYANGNLVSINTEGFFVIPNITEDLTMTIEEK